ncbi:MAG: YcnI family protein [Burkholderiaceae bacterium]|nr:YcnI family protein [Burkholderiaceae bacterium]
MLKTKAILITAATLALTVSLAAQAHVTLEQPEAEAGQSYKAVLRVGHGCEGSATTRVSVILPAGFRGAKPMPKAGWRLETRREALSQPYESHGRRISDELVEVSWTAQGEDNYLQDAWFDEFTVRGSLPSEASGQLWFKVKQQCVKGEWLWVEVPASGDSTRGLKAPAARLMLRKAGASANASAAPAASATAKP